MNQTIAVKGKEYPFRLELGASRLYAIKKGIKKFKTIDIQKEIMNADLIEDYPILLWAGLKAGAPTDQPFPHDLKEVRAWVDQDPGLLDRMIDIVNNEKLDNTPSSEGAGEGK